MLSGIQQLQEEPYSEQVNFPGQREGKMIPLRKLALAATCFMMISTVGALAKETVGEATLVKTRITGDGTTLAVSAPVHRDERIQTSSTGLGEFLFRDGTKFAVGWNSTVVIDKFVFDNPTTVKKLSLKAARGTFRWISGKSKSSAYEIVTPAGTLGVRGTGLDIFVGRGGVTAIVLLEGAATFCGRSGCQDLRRRCDVVVATPSGGVQSPEQIDRNMLNVLGSRRALPFLTGDQRLSRPFRRITNGCGMSSAAQRRTESGGSVERDRPEPSRPDPEPDDGCGGDCR